MPLAGQLPCLAPARLHGRVAAEMLFAALPRQANLFFAFAITAPFVFGA
jgi:hypothetical protein